MKLDIGEKGVKTMVNITDLKKEYDALMSLVDQLLAEIHEICSKYDDECTVELESNYALGGKFKVNMTLDKHMPLADLVKIEEKGGTFIRVTHNETSDCCGFCTYSFYFILDDTECCCDGD